MSTRLKLKIFLVVFLIIFAGLLLLPTFVPNLPPWFTKYVYRGRLKLGLDLKGGFSATYTKNGGGYDAFFG